LHNNIAMLHYKRKEFKKAKLHSEKIVNELNEIDGVVGAKVHFNIGKIFSQGYNYDLPLKHFHEAKILLSKLDENKDPAVRGYKEMVVREIEELEKMRIDEVSEEESYKFSYMSSSLLKKV
jgi:type III secretory pathway lipoprotein EscJ